MSELSEKIEALEKEVKSWRDGCHRAEQSLTAREREIITHNEAMKVMYESRETLGEQLKKVCWERDEAIADAVRERRAAVELGKHLGVAEAQLAARRDFTLTAEVEYHKPPAADAGMHNIEDLGPDWLRDRAAQLLQPFLRPYGLAAQSGKVRLERVREIVDAIIEAAREQKA